MKSISKIILVVSLMLSWQANALASEIGKQYYKSWPKKEITNMKIINKFGEVRVNDTGGDSVSVKVVVKITSTSKNRATNLLNKINIKMQLVDGQVIGQTIIDEGFKNDGPFSIDYVVNIPKNRDLYIYNKYGDININMLEAKGEFDLSYGSMVAGKIKSPVGIPVKVIINYGKVTFESVNEAEIEIKYSKLYADQINKLALVSKYSTVNISRTSELTLASKYDGINIDDVERMKSVSKYTNYKIGMLNVSLSLSTDYGSVNIGRVSPKFDNIHITNSYGGMNIGLGASSYKLKANGSYCSIFYPSGRFKGNTNITNRDFSIDGTVGESGGVVVIESRYGDVKLMER